MRITRHSQWMLAIVAGVVSAALEFCVSVPQLLMLAARPIYHVMFGVTDSNVWIANVVWTPICGLPATVAERHLGVPHGPLTFGPFLLWGLLVVPSLVGALAGRAVFSAFCPHAELRKRRRNLILLAMLVLSLFLNFPIPITTLMGELGFGWTTY